MTKEGLKKKEEPGYKEGEVSDVSYSKLKNRLPYTTAAHNSSLSSPQSQYAKLILKDKQHREKVWGLYSKTLSIVFLIDLPGLEEEVALSPCRASWCFPEMIIYH